MVVSDENMKFKLLTEKLNQKCVEIQTENERIVLRINKTRRILRKKQRDIELLKRRLDKFNDGWRSIPMVAANPKRKIEQKRGRKPKVKDTEEKQPKEKKQRAKKLAVESINKDVVANTAQFQTPDRSLGEYIKLPFPDGNDVQN
ncbi:uncharacterized protein LOC119670464 [Teleopsis dalmanni]|uniref:uncharacterized protein LOC119670464 n=1 Tax=Teleopsis dalmanni TaxID=139649 RepID=UPI000D32AA5A|nr:uncharacterized protein LOC119670464 [Teleopsis dalmanni]